VEPTSAAPEEVVSSSADEPLVSASSSGFPESVEVAVDSDPVVADPLVVMVVSVDVAVAGWHAPSTQTSDPSNEH